MSAPHLREHPDFRSLYAELHARPFPVLHAPVQVAHLAVLREGWDEDAEDTHLARLFPGPVTERGRPFAGGARSHLLTLGPLGMRLERHAEFSAYTFFCASPRPFERDPLSCLPSGWLADLHGRVVAHLAIAVERRPAPEHDPEHVACHLRSGQVVGSRVVYGTASLWTDFALDGNGACRFLVEDHALSPERAGRLVQRLIELETYRQMALLALPLARRLAHRLPKLDAELARIVAGFSEPATDDRHETDRERQQLAALTNLAVENERLLAESARRFSATRAYHQIVQDRLKELREQEIPGYQTIAEFLDRRLTPAVRTCIAHEDHLEHLSSHLSTATDLLRTRVNLTLEAQNQRLLTSMDRRHAMQLRLQTVAEGLSVVVLTYYLLGLVKHLLGVVHLDERTHDLAMATAVPVVLFAVWLAIRRVRERLHRSER